MGIICVDRIDLNQKDTAAMRSNLDHVGAHWRFLLEQKSGHNLRVINDVELTKPGPQYEGRGNETTGEIIYPRARRYNAGQYDLESCQWLAIEGVGKLREQRETTWYLGLNFGSENYLLIYISLEGATNIRERLSAILWYFAHTARSHALSAGRQAFDVAELRDEICSILRGYVRAGSLTKVSISFTNFDRTGGVARSGHFGAARPYMIGQTNQVSPLNDVIIHLDDGSDVRFWEVTARLDDPHLYVLTGDPTRIEGDPTKSMITRLSPEPSTGGGDYNENRSLRNLIEKIFVQENVPRYYVAVQLRRPASEPKAELPRALEPAS
jgi:hypothetical protein